MPQALEQLCSSKARSFTLNTCEFSVTGTGLQYFVGVETDDWREHNHVDVTVPLAYARHLAPADFQLLLAADGTPISSIITVHSITDDVFRCVFSVPDPALTAIEVSVSVCGVALCAGQARHVQRGCHAAGIAIGTIALPHARNNTGLAVFEDSSLLVVTGREADVTFMSLHDGQSHTTSAPGVRVGQYRFPHKLCMTPAGTVLIADSLNRRVHEITAVGAHVRFLGLGVLDQPVISVDMHNDLVVAGKTGSETSDVRSPRLVLMSYSTGALVRQFGECGDAPGQLLRVNSVRFTRDGSQLVIAEYKHARVSLYTVDGAFVRVIGDALLRGPRDVVPLDNGTIAVIDMDSNSVFVFRLADGAFVRSWGSSTGVPLKHPCAAVCRAGKLYVLNANAGNVLVLL